MALWWSDSTVVCTWTSLSFCNLFFVERMSDASVRAGHRKEVLFSAQCKIEGVWADYLVVSRAIKISVISSRDTGNSI